MKYFTDYDIAKLTQEEVLEVWRGAKEREYQKAKEASLLRFKQQHCLHNYEYDGHDSHKDYYKCKLCGHIYSE